MKANLEGQRGVLGLAGVPGPGAFTVPCSQSPAEWGVGIRSSQVRGSLPHIPILVTTFTSKIPGNAFSVTDTNPREAEFKVLF